MRGTLWWTGSLALACIMAGGLAGCGKAPSPPTAIPEAQAQRVGAGSKGQTDTDVLTVRPSPDAVMATPPPGQTDDDIDEAADDLDQAADDIEDPSEASPDEPDADPAPAASQAGPVFSACHQTRVVGCDELYVRMVKTAPDLCVQLVLDNCDENRRQGLPVAVPLSWRLTSSSASTDRGCELRKYDPKSQPVLTASGTVNFAQQGHQISALELDVQLSLNATSEAKLPAQIAVTTPSPIEDIETCED